MDTERDSASSRLPGFYELSLDERHDRLSAIVPLGAVERYQLKREALPLSTADQMIENVVGVFGLPLGLAVNFVINDRDYVIPLAVEESSVVAGASHIAKLIRSHGQITTRSTDPLMIGQIQIVGLPDPEPARDRILEARDRILEIANEQDPPLLEAGGGAKDIEVRLLDTTRGPMLVVHLVVDVRDAMGGNVVNTMAEALTLFLEGVTGGKVCLRILSNLADRRLAMADLELSPEAFNEHEWRGDEVVESILDADAFANADPYRAATNNKGIMNAVDGLMIATGNDWRAVEAGAHAYAARDGQYRPLSRWERSPEGKLLGHIELPMPVGIIGGATRVHPCAQLALRILRVKSARELAEVAAALGLVQNLAALRSLVTEGIQRGHMVLHARNVAASAGAVGETVSDIANQMIREGRIGFYRARQLLSRFLRGTGPRESPETPDKEDKKSTKKGHTDHNETT